MVNGNFMIEMARLLLAVENNELHIVRKLIQGNPELLNRNYGRSANNPILYIAIFNFASEILSETVDTLIELGADLFYRNVADDHKEAIHFAVMGQNPLVLRTIIRHIKSVDRINSTTASGNTALHLLIKRGDVNSTNFEKCLNILLESNVKSDVNKVDGNNETPILIAARKKYKKAVTQIINSGKTVDIDTHKFQEKTARMLIEEYKLYDGNLPDFTTNNDNLNQSNANTLPMDYVIARNEEGFLNFPNISAHVGDSNDDGTLLQLSCERNLKNIVKYLLENKADVVKVTEKNKKFPIEIAAENGFWRIFKYLLPRYIKIPDNVLIVLLQKIFYDTSYFGISEKNYKKCLSLLLEQTFIEVPVNSYAANGKTPLHYAVKYADSDIILNLLTRGASLANRDSFGILPVEDIDARTLEKYFDSCLTTEYSRLFDKKSTIVTFDYKSLLPTIIPKIINKVDVENNLKADKNNYLVRETDVVLEISRSLELRHLLNHALISSFLYIKWHKIRWFFYVNLIFYSLFVISLVLHVFYQECHKIYSMSFIIYTVLISMYIILSLREFFQFLILPKTYFLQFENLLEVSIIILTGIIIFRNHEDFRLYKQLSAVVILLSSLELMLLIGQHPYLSTNIVIFRTVSLNFFKFLLWYSILILAFMLSFYKLFNNIKEGNSTNSTVAGENNEQDFFAEPTMTFIKIIIMLTGEFDASSMNFESISNKLVFLVFVFLIPIILFNLLNGLAVSDTQTIKNNAEIIDQIERINYIVYIENMIFENVVYSILFWILSKCDSCCRSVNLKKYAVPNWFAQKITLSLHTRTNYKLQIYLYSDGKIVRDEFDDDEEGFWKKRKNMYLDKKTVKRVKKLLVERNDVSLEQKVGDLEKQIKILQELLSKSNR